MCNSLQGFQETRKLNDGEVILHLGSDAQAVAMSLRLFTFIFNLVRLVLLDVLFVPTIMWNLLSVSALASHNYTFASGTDIIIKRVGSFVCSGRMVNGLYLITPSMFEIHEIQLVSRSQTKNLKGKVPTSEPIKHWHLKLGRSNLNRINGLVKERVLPSLVVESMEVYESCL